MHKQEMNAGAYLCFPSSKLMRQQLETLKDIKSQEQENTRENENR